MLKLFFAVFLCILSFGNLYSQFVVNDIVAVSAQASIFDPEYNPQLNLVCWKSDNNDLWISGLDPASHLYKPSNGKGTYVTGNLAPNGAESWNGPEWMLSKQGTQIVYVKALWGTRYPGIATMVLGGWQCFTLMQYPDVVYTMASSDYTDSIARLLFETFEENGIYWLSNTDFGTCFYYPEVTLGFFARDNQQICCATNKSRHPGFIETACTLPFLTSISQDTIGAPFMWLDPATNSRLFMYRTNGFRTLKIFQELAPDFWVQYNKFDSPLPDDFQYITSPEPFICGGRSYVSFMAAQSSSGKDGLPAQIWIASADPTDSLMRRVSDSTIGIRTDPEPVVFSDSAFVYYTDIVSDNSSLPKYSVRKCDTGLGNLITTPKKMDKASTVVSVYPNPGNGLFSLNAGNGFVPGSLVNVFDVGGNKVFNTLLEGKSTDIDLRSLPEGNYFLKYQSLSEEAILKIIIAK